MATLPRPGVEISQEIVVESPTVVSPSLVPCLIGPCYQIVSPLTDTGGLNPEAQVSISAVLSSNSALGDTLNLSNRSMVLNINGTGEQTIQFPPSASGISQALAENTINKGLTGAVAEFIEDKLVIRTLAKGPTASITVIEVVADSAYGSGEDDILAMNAFVGKTIRGKTTYDNSSYTIPYSSFPSPKTDVSEIVLDKDDIDITIFYDGRATELSEDSAIIANSYLVNTTTIGGTAASIAFQPALSAGHNVESAGAQTNGRVSLVGRPSSGSQTNVLVHPGTEASLLLPLCHAIAPNAAPSALWPDVTGASQVLITCIGKTSFLETNTAENLGLIDGAAGNAIQVVIDSSGPAASCTATYAAAVLTITGSATTPFSAVEAAITSDSFQSEIAEVLTVALSVPEDGDAICDFTQFADTYFLGGGSDPVDFSSDAGSDDAGNDLSRAYVCGSVQVGGSNPEDLGIAGEVLLVSIDGGEPIEVSLDAGTSIVTLIDNALGDDGTATQATIVNTLGETITGCLQMCTASTNGSDSSISVNASSSRVLEKLFSGKTIQSETVAASAVFDTGLGAEVQDRMFVIESGADFNTQATSVMMKAIQNGNTTIEVSGLLAMAGIVLDLETDGSIATDAVAGPAPGVVNLGVKVDGDAAVAVAIDRDACTATQNTVDEINNALSVAGLASVKATKLGSSTNRVLVYNTGAAGSSLELESATSTDWVTVFSADVFDSVVTSASVVVEINDKGTNNSLQIAAVSNSMAHILASSDTSAAMSDTDYGLGLDESSVSHSNGKISISFQKDQESVGDGGAATFKVHAGTSISALEYYRVWANNTQTGAPSYHGRVYQGMADKLAVSDTLHNDGQILGRIVGIDSFGAGSSTYAGGKITISEFAVSNNSAISSWYARAENLISGGERIEPEVVASNLSQSVAIKPGLLRSSAGLPMSSDSAPVYVGYKALRKDVSADTANPNLMVFNSISEVETFIGPIRQDNTLAFGMYMAFLNTTNISLSAFGVSAVSSDAPNGTLEAYAEALDYLKLKEVYALAPLTDDMNVFRKFSQHVTDMSEAAAKKERMAICCPSLPTEESPTLAASGNFKAEAIGGGKYRLSLHIQSELDQTKLHLALNGKTDANGNAIVGAIDAAFTPDQGIYIDREGDANYYLVVSVDASSVVIETSDVYQSGLSGPGTGGNGDGFFKEGADAIAALADFEVDGEQCSLFIRQAALDMRSTGGRLKTCEGLAEIAGGVTGFQNRRLVLVQPEQVGVDIAGLETVVPGHFLCGAIAAMIGQQTPSQPFTNLPMVGFTRPIGSNDKFSEEQMATAAAGGVYWVIQDVEGGALASRHQLTTDVTGLKTRELSILKSVDFVAKLIRTQVKRFIGRRNITRQLLETVSLGIGGALNSVSGSVVASATLDMIAQDPSSPDSIILEVSLTPYYPANKIKVTIFV